MINKQSTGNEVAVYIASNTLGGFLIGALEGVIFTPIFNPGLGNMKYQIIRFGLPLSVVSFTHAVLKSFIFKYTDIDEEDKNASYAISAVAPLVATIPLFLVLGIPKLTRYPPEFQRMIDELGIYRREPRRGSVSVRQNLKFLATARPELIGPRNRLMKKLNFDQYHPDSIKRRKNIIKNMLVSTVSWAMTSGLAIGVEFISRAAVEYSP